MVLWPPNNFESDTGETLSEQSHEQIFFPTTLMEPNNFQQATGEELQDAVDAMTLNEDVTINDYIFWSSTRDGMFNDVRRVTLGTLLDMLELEAINPTAAQIAAIISGVAAKATPVDADVFTLTDSAASHALKKVTWANIKATLKTYNDTLYGYTHPNHTGDVTSTGDGATVIAPTAISGKTLFAGLLGTEEVLINDGGTLKKTTTQDIADLGPGGGGGTPGGSDTQLQYNNAGAFGGASIIYETDFLSLGLLALMTADHSTTPLAWYLAAGSALTGDNNGASAAMTAGNGHGTGAGGTLILGSLEGQTMSGGDTGPGGEIYILAGLGGLTSGAGGNITLNAGSARGGNSDGGAVGFYSGNGVGSGNGGLLSLQSGSANSDSGGTGNGGGLELYAGYGGDAGGDGGSFILQAGGAYGGNGNGGDITFITGHKDGSGTAGKFFFRQGGVSYKGILDFSGLTTSNKTFTFPDITGTLSLIANTETLTNKRITSRVTTITSSATPTINTDNCDAVTITALAAAITSMTTNLSGTPTNFQKLIIRIKDNGTARAITWGASFEAKGTALPTTTVISKVLTVGFIYDTVTSKFGCVASAQEA